MAWPASVPVTYAAPVLQGVQVASPSLEKVLAGHALQLSWLVALHGALATEPAPQEVAHEAHGERPDALHETPATQGRRTHADTFHEYEAAQAHELWPVRMFPLAL